MLKPGDAENCGNCYFYQDMRCHRNPPQTRNSHHKAEGGFVEQRIPISEWPHVRKDAWCGEFREN